MGEGTNDTYLELSTMRNVLHVLIRISIPYIFLVSILGIGGNFLTIIMLLKKSLSKNFNNCTLIALALTDLLFNFTLVSRCISDLTHSNSEQLCRLLAFLSHLAEFLSACFTAHFTAQRFIAVRFPLSVFMEKRIHLIHYFIVLFLIVFGILYCLALVRYNQYDICHEELYLKWFISDALLSFLIPFTIITILNILIISHLKNSFHRNSQFRFGKRHLQSTEILPLNFRKKTSSSSSYETPLQKTSRGRSSGNGSIDNVRGSFPTNVETVSLNERNRSIDLIQRPSAIRTKSQSYRVTRMLIVVSTCFLLLNAPAHICTIGLKIYTIKNIISIDREDHLSSVNQTLVIIPKFSKQNETIEYEDNMKWAELSYIIVIITQHIAYASYSINFFLYSFCGMKFRRELVRCVSTSRRKLTDTIQNTS